jgi:hypothetical protein
LFAVDDRLIPQLFDGDEDANTIANFLDSHLLENFLVTFDEVVPVEVVGFEKSLILATIDAVEPSDHLLFIPGSSHKLAVHRLRIPWS